METGETLIEVDAFHRTGIKPKKIKGSSKKAETLDFNWYTFVDTFRTQLNNLSIGILDTIHVAQNQINDGFMAVEQWQSLRLRLWLKRTFVVGH